MFWSVSRKLDELLFALMQNMMLTVSGEKLAKDLGVSHSTLARWIETLAPSVARIPWTICPPSKACSTEGRTRR